MEVGWTQRTSIPLATHQFPRLPHTFCAVCPVLFFLLWTVLLGPHQDLWLCDLLYDEWHEQPLNEVVEALAAKIFVHFLFLHHGTSLYNTLFTCLRFVQLQSNFRQSLTEYIAKVARTFESLIWLSGRAAWNFHLSLLLPIPRTRLPAAAVYPLWAFCTSAFSSSFWFLCLIFASLFSLIATKSHQIPISSFATWHIKSFSGYFHHDCLCAFLEVFWGYFILYIQDCAPNKALLLTTCCVIQRQYRKR